MRISYRVKFSDLFWTYYGDRKDMRLALGGAAALLFLAAIKWDPAYVAWSLALLLGGPVLLPVGFMLSAGTLGRVGCQVDLVLDEEGVSGWPVAPKIDRSWGNLDWTRMRRSVVVLEFRFYASRQGWVVIPLRAVPSGQRDSFRRMLIERGNLDPFPSDGGDLPRSGGVWE